MNPVATVTRMVLPESKRVALCDVKFPAYPFAKGECLSIRVPIER